jgi:hypothetical protein
MKNIGCAALWALVCFPGAEDDNCQDDDDDDDDNDDHDDNENENEDVA